MSRCRRIHFGGSTFFADERKDMKLRDRRGWRVRLKRGRPLKNAIRIIRHTCLIRTIKYRHL